jgi:AcrR family transcriptional regulator
MARLQLYSNEKILKAAAREFLRHGPKAGTIPIARRAGVSEATLFKRFKTKEALFRAAMHLEAENLAWPQELLAAIGKRTPARNLQHALSSLADHLEIVLPKMMLLRVSGYRKRLGKSRQQTEPPLRDARILADYLRAEQKLGRLPRRGNPLVHAHQIVGALAHYFNIKTMTGFAPCPRPDYIRALVRLHT